jgi:hypothetical protein
VPDFVETSHLRAYQDPQRDIVDHFAGLLTVGQVLPFKYRAAADQQLTIYLAHAVAGPGPCRDPLVADHAMTESIPTGRRVVASSGR